MNNKSDYQLLVMQAIIDAHRQYSDKKMKKQTEYLTSMIASIMDQIKISKYLPASKYSPKSQYPTIVVPDNKKAPPLEGVHNTKIGGM